MVRPIVASAIVTAAGVAALWGVALAQTGSSTTGPTHADFEECNRQAQKGAGASASPGARVAGSATWGASVRRPSGTIGSGGSAAGAGEAAGDSLTGGSTLSAGGSLSGGGSATGGSTPSGSIDSSADAQLRGMAAAGEGDPGYRTAYRDCMRSRGF